MPFHIPLARWVVYTSPAEVKGVQFVDLGCGKDTGWCPQGRV